MTTRIWANGKISGLAAAILSIGVSATTAVAGNVVNVTCAEFNNQADTINQYSELSITMAAGDVVSGLRSGLLFATLIDGPPTAPELTPFNYTATTTPDLFQITLEAGSTISCVLAAFVKTKKLPAVQGSEFSANSQSRSINTGIGNNARSRLSGGGNQVTRNQVFISTQNLGKSQLETPEWNAWVSVEGRKYNGGQSGYSADVVVGADKLFSDNFLAGFLLSVDRTDITGAGGRSEVTSQALGAYFASRVSDGLFLDGYLSFSNPKNQTGGATFRSSRTMVGLSLTGTYQMASGTLRPFARVNGYSEKQPAYTGGGGPVAANNVNSYVAAVGARYEPSAEFGTTGLKPYFSAALDYNHIGSTIAGTTKFTYPRVGMGLSGPVGAGNLSLDLDGGKFNTTTYDFGLRATYEFKF